MGSDQLFFTISKKIENVVRSKENTCDKLIAFANPCLDEFRELSRKGECPILNAAIDSDNIHQLGSDFILIDQNDLTSDLSTGSRLRENLPLVQLSMVLCLVAGSAKKLFGIASG